MPNGPPSPVCPKANTTTAPRAGAAITATSRWSTSGRTRRFCTTTRSAPNCAAGATARRTIFYRSSYVDASQPGKPPLPAAKQPACWQYDPSVEGRFKLYVASMNELLNPAQRLPKETLLDHDIVLDIGPRLWDGSEEKQLAGFSIRIPAGSPADAVGNFQHKAFINDVISATLHPRELQTRLTGEVGADDAKKLVAELQGVAKSVLLDPSKMLDAVAAARKRLPLIGEVYSSCTDDIENDGHRFGEDLSPADKKALIAFLATL
jgi:hypothetical protein